MEDEAVVSCPIHTCAFEIPVDYEDVARERHRQEHTAQEWDDLVGSMRAAQESSRAAHEKYSAQVDGWIARVGEWSGRGD